MLEAIAGAVWLLVKIVFFAVTAVLAIIGAIVALFLTGSSRSERLGEADEYGEEW